MTKKETKAPDQQSLFGEADHVFNVLHTRLTDLNDGLHKCEEIIEKKEREIKVLLKEKRETEKAIKIVGKQRDKVKPKAAEKKKTKPAPF